MDPILFYPLALGLFIFLLVQALLAAAMLTNSHTLAYYGRCIAAVAALVVCAIYGTIASAVLNVVGYGGLGQWTTARAFKWVGWLVLGVWYEMIDENDWVNTTRPAVFVGNHQTELDILFLAHAFPKYCSVTAKKSLKYTPFLGWFMAMSKTVFVERASREQAVAAFAKAAEQMHSIRQSVYIFPEGTRSYAEKPEMLPFKKGAFHLAIQAQVPIVPLVVANYSNVFNIKHRVFRQGTIPIKVLEPIPTKGKTKEDVDALLAETREKMMAALQGLTAQARDETIVPVKVEKPIRQVHVQARSTGIETTQYRAKS